jgi:beta-lactamase class A
MVEIFESPDIPHQQIKLLRKSGSWENWLHDSAVVRGPDRHYILVAITNHPQGDAYLEALAGAVDDVMKPKK